MPSGPPELHRKWKDDGNAIRFLEHRGYKLLKNYDLQLPEAGHVPTDEEREAGVYLVLEWDYGTFVEPPTQPPGAPND